MLQHFILSLEYKDRLYVIKSALFQTEDMHLCMLTKYVHTSSSEIVALPIVIKTIKDAMKWTKITVIGVMVVIITNLTTWFLSSHEIEWDDNHIPCNYYSTHNALVAERQYCGAIFEILHDYWEFLDVQYTDSTVVRHAFWKDVIMEGDAYHTADSINGGDWEDFFYHWYTEDDCHHE